MIRITKTYDEDDRLETAVGTCECGEILDFMDYDVYATVECQSCHRLYNTSGQELRPRDEWEEPLEEDY